MSVRRVRENLTHGARWRREETNASRLRRAAWAPPADPTVFTGSAVVVDEVAAGRVDESGFPERPAVPDTGGQGEHSLTDPGPDAFGDVAAVEFQRELALGGLVDRLDPLADAAELAEPGLFVFAVGADEGGVQSRDCLLELAPGEAFVADDDLLAGEEPLAAGAVEHRRGDLALGLVRRGQAEADRHPVWRAQQIQPQAPEVARMRGAVAVGGPAGQLRALAGLARLAARHRRGVQESEPIAERRGDPRQVADDQADLGCQRPQPLVVARLLGNVGEQMPELLAREAQEPPLGMALQQDLRDRERDELRRGDPWASACTASGRQEIVHQHVKCDEKVVEVGEHRATSVVDVAVATPTFDDLPIPPRAATTAATDSESLI